MSGIDYYKPVMAMIGMQLTYAGVALSTRAALLQGMSPSVFVFYRRSERSCLGLRSFCLIFLASLVGLEKVDIRTLRSIAKIIGTVLCVGGAVSMVLLRGPKLLNNSGGENWLVGSFLLFGSSCCWSFWIIFQVPVSASYPDHLSLSAWMCFMATLQSGTIALFLEHNPEAWILHSYLELASCLYAGIIGSATSFFVQAWCISRRGPLFCAMFSPLATVIVTIFASIFLHEEIYIGSLIGAVGVIVGLYVVLWGKAQEHKELKTDTVSISNDDQSTIAEILVDGSSKNMACTSTTDLEKPFLFV
ncbi:WAT1-related protein At4g30420-like isoform X4 [Rhododendron vialii]|uniref:WAT1-related protein At4g30420-like isoform X4 n=1 Tax=Rhododendron vialii TaxID=182163 RepID=UPI00265EB8DE|nr:WAT1-related protein At4g30420-like isoform X4 [Rhododendron vialii]